jgi:hypothetical protein
MKDLVCYSMKLKQIFQSGKLIRGYLLGHCDPFPLFHLMTIYSVLLTKYFIQLLLKILSTVYSVSYLHLKTVLWNYDVKF